MFSSFMTNAWVIGTIVAIIAGVIGFFVTLQKAPFDAHAIPMSSFAGAAAATWLGINQLYGLTLFALLGITIITLLRKTTRHEVATALTLVALLGTGALCLSMTRAYAQAVFGLMFGDILGVSNEQILPVLILGGIAVVIVCLLYRPLLLMAVLPELSFARGVRTSVVSLGFLIALALATIVALPVVGALLVFSLMITPPASARLLTQRPLIALVLSIVIALVIIWCSIALSYITNWPIGFYVGALGAGIYILARTARRFASIFLKDEQPGGNKPHPSIHNAD